MMSWQFGNEENEFVAAVAAAAFAIYSLDQTEAKYKRGLTEKYENPRTDIRTRKEDNYVGITRHSFTKELKDTGETSARKPFAVAMTSRKPSRAASTDQRQRGNSMKNNVVENKVDSWENARLRKINKRYEKMKADVIAWENAKKMDAKLHMERKKNELEMRKIRSMQHYQIKVNKIEAVARGAKGQLEEKRRNEESGVKEKAKYMRSKGKYPVKCFCC